MLNIWAVAMINSDLEVPIFFSKYPQFYRLIFLNNYTHPYLIPLFFEDIVNFHIFTIIFNSDIYRSISFPPIAFIFHLFLIINSTRICRTFQVHNYFGAVNFRCLQGIWTFYLWTVGYISGRVVDFLRVLYCFRCRFFASGCSCAFRSRYRTGVSAYVVRCTLGNGNYLLTTVNILYDVYKLSQMFLQLSQTTNLYQFEIIKLFKIQNKITKMFLYIF